MTTTTATSIGGYFADGWRCLFVSPRQWSWRQWAAIGYLVLVLLDMATTSYLISTGDFVEGNPEAAFFFDGLSLPLTYLLELPIQALVILLISAKPRSGATWTISVVVWLIVAAKLFVVGSNLRFVVEELTGAI